MKALPASWITYTCTRRTFLQAVAAGLVVAGVPGCRKEPAKTTPVAGGQQAWLAKIIGADDAAAQFGRLYLEAHPEENDRAVLVGLIEQASGRETDSTSPADPAVVAAALQRVVRAEYARDAVVAVDGWVLSVTEARIYALVAVSGA